MDVGRPPPDGPILPSHVNEVCKADPRPIHSPGLWDQSNAKNFLSYALPRLQLQLAVIFFLTQSIYIFLRRFHLSRIVSEILAGIILGPTVLGAIIPNFTETLFPPEGEIYLQLLSKIGFTFFMFLIGVKMDTSLVVKSGKRAWTIGLLSITILVVVALTVSPFMDPIVDINKIGAIKMVIGVQTFSPFPVIACLLTDLKITNTELGRLSLASSLIKDISNTLLGILINYARVGAAGTNVAGMLVLVLYIVFVLTMVFVGRAVFSWIIKQTPEGKPVNGVYIVFVSVAVLLSSIISDNLGIQYHFGPFILGLIVPGGPPLGATLVETFDTFISGLFTPLLLTYCGLKSNLLVVYNLTFISIVWISVFVAAVVKLASTFSLALFCKMPVKDATSLAIIMSTQGVVELAMYHSYRKNSVLDNP
ncbi:hypothetical protein F0562_026215 [Nyssa sinensis]|uniref:Cation/H+ exchanger transmembrane domain-containing protein n=1 Tax=Nyssa sinensis TaxID=561372 RepID=A0A5J5B8L5_9ASTE|nr:hypothetical protein F0562_026215 [Nyssa sinensis]